MNTRIRTAATAAALALTAAACAKDAAKADLDTPKIKGDIVPSSFETLSPDSVTVYANVDSHPTIIRVCLDGVAFRTVSDHYSGLATPAVDRVPEWDAYCKTVDK